MRNHTFAGGHFVYANFALLANFLSFNIFFFNIFTYSTNLICHKLLFCSFYSPKHYWVVKIWKTAYFFEIAAILNILTILFYPKCTTVVFIVLLDLTNMGFATKIRSLRCAWADIWAIVNLPILRRPFWKMVKMASPSQDI